ncbi:hypothetical protein ACO0K9_11470 [Undibacterium sp. Ji50W]|uniref:hypothetical protein n=1 Tax=Undibacterium sp. Ji50W TaxID=3413041 RepID=UPI003BF1075E
MKKNVVEIMFGLKLEPAVQTCQAGMVARGSFMLPMPWLAALLAVGKLFPGM